MIGWTTRTICDVEDGRVGDFYGLFPMSETDVDSEKKKDFGVGGTDNSPRNPVTQNILRMNTHFLLIGK